MSHLAVGCSGAHVRALEVWGLCCLSPGTGTARTERRIRGS